MRLEELRLDEIIIALAVLCFIVQIAVARWAWKFRGLLPIADDGGRLLRVLLRALLGSVLCQAIVVVNTLLRFMDPIETMPFRSLLIIIEQVVLTYIFVSSAWLITQLPRHHDAQDAARERRETLEGVAEQVDHPVPPTGAPVD